MEWGCRFARKSVVTRNPAEHCNSQRQNRKMHDDAHSFDAVKAGGHLISCPFSTVELKGDESDPKRHTACDDAGSSVSARFPQLGAG